MFHYSEEPSSPLDVDSSLKDSLLGSEADAKQDPPINQKEQLSLSLVEQNQRLTRPFTFRDQHFTQNVDSFAQVTVDLWVAEERTSRSL